MVQAVVTAEQAKQLVAGDIAELSLAGGEVAYGTLARDAQALKPVGNQGEVRALIAHRRTSRGRDRRTVSVRIINRHIFAARQKVASGSTPSRQADRHV